jgi:hypothetical protein
MKRVALSLVCAVMAMNAPGFGGDSAASAQVMVRSSLGGPMGGAAQLSLRTFKRMLTPMGLDQTQEEAAVMLHEVYTAECKAAQEEMRAKLEEASAQAQESGRFRGMDGSLMDALKDGDRQREASLHRLFSDVQSLLTTAQKDSWPRSERLYRRAVNARRATVSGEGLDLADIVQTMLTKPAPDGAAAPAASTELTQTLDQYELDMDRAIQHRDNSASEAAEKFEKARREAREKQDGPMHMVELAGMGDADEMKRMREASIAVRDVNERYAKTIEPLLPESLREEFRTSVLHKAFPRVYRPSRAESALTAALKFDTLTEQQRGDLQAALDAHRKTIAPINERWMQATRERDEKGGGGFMIPGGASIQMRDGEDTSDYAKAQGERGDLDTKSMSRVKEILTEDQFANLPKARQGVWALGGDMELEGAEIAGEHVMMVIESTEGAPVAPAVIAPAPAEPGK